SCVPPTGLAPSASRLADRPECPLDTHPRRAPSGSASSSTTRARRRCWATLRPRKRFQCGGSLEREDAVPEGGELLVVSESMIRVGDPARFETHQPLYELWCRPRPFRLVQERRRGGASSADVFPSGDGSGVASPAVKMPSIRDHSGADSLLCVGEPCGPCRARSMIWCDSAIVPRRARTCARLSPPR